MSLPLALTIHNKRINNKKVHNLISTPRLKRRYYCWRSKDKNIFYYEDFAKSFGGVDSTYAASKLLPYRNRHLVKFDIEASYRKINIGYGVQYYSKFDNIDPLLYIIIPGLPKFMRSVGGGDWVHQARIGVNISPNLTVSFIVNNVMNLEYATRPARMDPPRTFNLQMRFKI